MLSILDRMRLERRITTVVLAILVAAAFLYNLFFAHVYHYTDDDFTAGQVNSSMDDVDQ